VHDASQSTASFALQLARTLIGLHMALHSAVGGTTTHCAFARTSIAPHADKSARAVAWLKQIKAALSAVTRPSVPKEMCIEACSWLGRG
jgi:hypothetical protein